MIFREILLSSGEQLNNLVPVVHPLKIFMCGKKPFLN